VAVTTTTIVFFVLLGRDRWPPRRPVAARRREQLGPQQTPQFTLQLVRLGGAATFTHYCVYI
jgi:hypothetical protein